MQAYPHSFAHPFHTFFIASGKAHLQILIIIHILHILLLLPPYTPVLNTGHIQTESERVKRAQIFSSKDNSLHRAHVCNAAKET